jgi:hypothetical protein
VAINRIGPFDFIELGAPPPLVGAQIAGHHRAGVDGVMLQKLGAWADPFEIESLSGAIDYARAWALYAEYQLLRGAPPVELVWSDFPLSVARHAFYVLDVRAQSIQNLLVGVSPGGLYFAEIRAVWRLQPVRF